MKSFDDQWEQLKRNIKKIGASATKKLDLVTDEENQHYVLVSVGDKGFHKAVLCIFKVSNNNEFTLQEQFQLSNSSNSGSKSIGPGNNCYAISKLGKTSMLFFQFEDEPAESYTLKEYQFSNNQVTDDNLDSFHFEVQSEGRPYWIIDMQFSHSNHEAKTKREWMEK